MSRHRDAAHDEARRMAQDAMSRRGFLGRAGMLMGAAVVSPAVLAACGSSGGSKGGGGGSKHISISNWTSYINKVSKTNFAKDTGIALTYTEDINDNNEYFAKVRPNLSRDQSIDRDGLF